MADINYPEGLPLPLQDGYGIQHQSPTVNQTSITGRGVPRRRFRAVPSQVSVSWKMNDAQAQLFEGWFAADAEYGGVADGTLWFNCRLSTPIGLKDYEARFMELYDGPSKVAFNLWKISATLQLKKRQILPPEWIPFPEFTLGSSIIDRALNQEWPEA